MDVLNLSMIESFCPVISDILLSLLAFHLISLDFNAKIFSSANFN